MNKGKKIFLVLVVIVVVAIVAMIALTTNTKPILLQEQMQYSEEQAADRLETLREAQNKHVVEVVPMKFFVNEIRPDDGTFTLTAITTMLVDDIAAVSFRAVNSADPSVEKWYEAENQGNGRYQLSGTAADLGNCSGTYTIEAFITPAGGGETEAGKTEIKMELTNYFYSEAVGEGRQSLSLAGPKADVDKPIKEVIFKVWTVDDDQDDIKIYHPEKDSHDVWTAEINVQDFEGKGDFIANAYAVFEEPEEVKSTSAEESESTSAGESKSTSAEESKSTSAEETKATSAGETKSTSAEESKSTSAEESKSTSAEESKSTSAEEDKDKDKAGKEEEIPEVELAENEIGIASEQFELLPEPMDLPEGAGEVVTEGRRVYIKDVPKLLQTPELPTGCESIALTIVLQSYGFELEKTEIAKKYLTFGTDMATSYVGDPFSNNGAGCFPPAVVDAANKYLKERNDRRTARNITGESIDDLCEYVDNGLPVIVWSSMYMASPDKTGGAYSYQGKSYQWYRSEHCVVLYGYDKTKDVYLVSDPLVGLVERDASAFKSIYDMIGKYAVVIY